jgi:hypothetical protein
MREFRITYKHAGWGGYAARIVDANTYREAMEAVGNPTHVRSLTMRCSHGTCKRWVNTDYCHSHEGLHT